MIYILYNIFIYIFLLISLCYSTPETYYISGTPSTDAYEWPRSYPQSCQCKEDGVTIKTCSIWQCTCACDLQAAICDYNCCCDPDCSDSQVNRFSDLDACLPEGYGSDTTQYCYSSLQLQRINPRTPLSGQATSMNAVGSALCVEKKNTPSKAEYYTDTDTTDYSVFSTDSGKKDYYYPDPTITTYTADSYYDYGDNIAAFYLDSSTYKPIGRGYLRLPRAGDGSGECIDENYVKFEKSESTTCVRIFTTDDISIAASKCKQLDYTHWVGDGSGAGGVYVGATADITPTTSVSASNLVVLSAPTITSTTSSTTSSTSGFKKIGTYYSNLIGTYSEVTSTTLAGVTPLTGTASGCTNVVIGVKYTITHDEKSAGTISSVTVELTTADFDFPPLGSTNVLAVPFTYSVEFVSADATTQSTNNGNKVKRERSGNPGYNMGKPVLYGTKSIIIEEWTTGLSIPSPLISQTVNLGSVPSASTCPTQPDITNGGQGLGYESVSFGYDVSTGCMLSLTRLNLKDFCEHTSTASTAFVDTSGYPYFFYDKQTAAIIAGGYVGIYGNADPLDVSQWLEFDVITPTLSTSWDDTNGICSGAITGIEYKFLVTQTGEKTHPQNKIIAAYAAFTSTDLTWTNGQTDTSSKKNFPLTVSVSFINKDDVSLKGYNPPAPPVLFKVPYDVFYPFYESSSASTSSKISYISMIIILISILLLML